MAFRAGPDQCAVVRIPLERCFIRVAGCRSLCEIQLLIESQVQRCTRRALVVGNRQVELHLFARLHIHGVCPAAAVLHELVKDRVCRNRHGRIATDIRLRRIRRCRRRGRRRSCCRGVIAGHADLDHQRLDLEVCCAHRSGHRVVGLRRLVDQRLRLNDLAVFVSLVVRIEDRVGVHVCTLVEVDLVGTVCQICRQVHRCGCQCIVICPCRAGVPGLYRCIQPYRIVLVRIGQVSRLACCNPCAVCVDVALRVLLHGLVRHPVQVPGLALEDRGAVGCLAGLVGIAVAVALQIAGVEAVRLCELRIRQRDAVVAPQILILRNLAGIADVLLAFFRLVVHSLRAVCSRVVQLRILNRSFAQRCIAVHGQLQCQRVQSCALRHIDRKRNLVTGARFNRIDAFAARIHRSEINDCLVNSSIRADRKGAAHSRRCDNQRR